MCVVVTDAVFKSTRYKGGIRCVLLAMADWADKKTHYCWPNIPAIAAKACLSPRQVKRIIKQLLKEKVLTLEERGNGRGHPSRYTIDLDELRFPSLNPEPERVTSEPEKGDTVSPKAEPERATSATGKGDICDRKGDICDRAIRNKPLIKATVNEPSLFPSSPNGAGVRSKSASGRKKSPPSEAKKSEVAHATIEEIYRAYPRHVGPAAAKKKIGKAITLIAKRFAGDHAAAAAWLLDRVKTYARSPASVTTEKQYIKHPSTWFNQGCYDDDDHEWEVNRNGNRNGSTVAERNQARIEKIFADMGEEGAGDADKRIPRTGLQ
jgi:Helix-turn-helix domain